SASALFFGLGLPPLVRQHAAVVDLPDLADRANRAAHSSRALDDGIQSSGHGATDRGDPDGLTPAAVGGKSQIARGPYLGERGIARSGEHNEISRAERLPAVKMPEPGKSFDRWPGVGGVLCTPLLITLVSAAHAADE